MTESSGVMGVAGVELLMGWTNVSKGSRSSSRRSRKLASTSPDFTMEQFDKTDDLSTSESEKIGASVLERRFSAKAEEIPFKKRNILFPPIPPSSSSPSSPSPRPMIEECEKSITELHPADVLLSSAEKTDVDDEFIHDIFETKHDPSQDDFSGIKMLAAVACNDRSRIHTSSDENMTPTIDQIMNIKDHGKQLDKSPNNSLTTLEDFTTIIDDRNKSGRSFKQCLSMSKRFHKNPHTLEEIKEEEECSCPGVDHEKNATSRNVRRERSPRDSLSSDEHEDSGVTSGSNSDHDCPKSVVDGPDAPKSDGRGSKSAEVACAPHVRNGRSVFPPFGTSRENDEGAAAKDDSSRVGANLGGGDSDLEDGEFRDSFARRWEGSEAECGEVEQVDYDSDDKFNETKGVTPVGSMEDETVDTGSCKRIRTRYSRTQCNIEFSREDGMNRFFDFRKAGTEFRADFDNENQNNEDGIRSNCCHSSCSRSRVPHYHQKHYRGRNFPSYIPKDMDMAHGCSDRRADDGGRPVFKRCAEAGNWTSEAENTLVYRERFVRPRRPFSREPNRGRPWHDHGRSHQVRPVARRHSPYYNRPSRPSPSPPPVRDFHSRHPATQFPRRLPWPEGDAFSYPRVGHVRKTRQRFRPSAAPAEAFRPWASRSYDRPIRMGRDSPPRRSVTPKRSPFLGGPLAGRDEGRRWEVRRLWGERRRNEEEGFVEDICGRWRW